MLKNNTHRRWEYKNYLNDFFWRSEYIFSPISKICFSIIMEKVSLIHIVRLCWWLIWVEKTFRIYFDEMKSIQNFELKISYMFFIVIRKSYMWHVQKCLLWMTSWSSRPSVSIVNITSSVINKHFLHFIHK